MRQQFNFADFRGGINVDVARDHLAEHELRVADNVDLSERGGLKKRDGMENVVGFDVDDKVTHTFEWPRNDGTVTLMAVVYKELTTDYRLFEVNDGVAVEVCTVAKAKIDHYVFQDKLYFLDSASYRVYDGTTVEDVGMPNVQVTAVDVPGSTMSIGTYFCFIRTTVPSATNIDIVDLTPPIPVELTQEGQGILWSNIPQPHDTVQNFGLYRTTGSEDEDGPFSEVVRYRLTQGDVVPETYTDTRTSFTTYIGSNTFKGTDLTHISRCKFAVRHTKSNRFFFAGDSNNQSALFFSEPNQPNMISPTSILYPTTGDGPITGLAIFVDAVLVFFKNSIWAWRGIDPELDAVWQKLPTAEGTEAPYTIALTTNSLTYMGSGGIYSLSPAILGYNVEVNVDRNLVNNIAEGKVTSLIKDAIDPEDASATFDAKNGRYMLALTPAGEATNSTTLVYDESLRAFVTWTGYNGYSLLYTRSGLYVGIDQRIVKFSPVHIDVAPDGTAQDIAVTMRTQSYSLGSGLLRFLLHRFILAIEGDQGAHPVTVKLYVDNALAYEETVDAQVTVDTLWMYRKKLREKGKRVEVEITHTNNKELKLYSIGFEANQIRTYGERI